MESQVSFFVSFLYRKKKYKIQNTKYKNTKIQNIITNTNFKKGWEGGGMDKEKRDVNWSMCLSTTP